MTSYQEILDRATQLASGLASAPGGGVDREMTVEAILPHAVRAVYRDQARTGRHLENINLDFKITLNRGSGTLSDEILREFLDRSYCPRNRYASFVPWHQYSGFLPYSNQLPYYSERGGQIFYNGTLPDVKAPLGICTTTSGNQTVTGSSVVGYAGDRVKILSGSTVLVDSFLAVPGSATFDLNARALNSGTATGALLSADDYAVERSVVDLATTSGNPSVSSNTIAFTQDDVGKRLRAYATGTVTPVVDAIIDAVQSATAATLRGRPLSTHALNDASIMSPQLLLRTPAIPSIQNCDCIRYVPEIVEDVIVKIAAVLRGELKLPQLVELGG